MLFKFLETLTRMSPIYAILFFAIVALAVAHDEDTRKLYENFFEIKMICFNMQNIYFCL